MKKIAYVTGSRAEYGIVKRLLKRLQEDKELQFSLIVTAMHLSPEYGETVNIIENDGFQIKEKIYISLDSKNNQTILTSMAECLDKFGKHFQDNVYDSVIVLGDRYEMLAVSIAAAMHNIPLIHLHGGEQTLGNYDEFIRHSITKMSKLHLVSTEEYRKRVIQLGEFPDSVHNIGSLGAENSLSLVLPSKEELMAKYDIEKIPYFLIVFHPETLNGNPISKQVDNLLVALNNFKDSYQFIFIGSNSDTNSDQIFDKFQNYTRSNNFKFFTSVKPEEYLALIKYSEGIIGNSSSGLLEAPSCGVGTVNIGNRQQGRVRGESVIDVKIETDEIIKGISKLISQEFKSKLPQMSNPYYQDNSMEKAFLSIKHFLEQQNKSAPKAFFDLENI